MDRRRFSIQSGHRLPYAARGITNARTLNSAALILAGKEIRKLNFGRADSPVLVVLRRVLREARAVARKEGVTTRVRLELPK